MTLLASLGTVPTMDLLSRRQIWGVLYGYQGTEITKDALLFFMLLSTCSYIVGG